MLEDAVGCERACMAPKDLPRTSFYRSITALTAPYDCKQSTSLLHTQHLTIVYTVLSVTKDETDTLETHPIETHPIEIDPIRIHSIKIDSIELD